MLVEHSMAERQLFVRVVVPSNDVKSAAVLITPVYKVALAAGVQCLNRAAIKAFLIM